jgi:hypothetical protein
MLSVDDTIYVTAMLMFACLPVMSMRARLRHPGSSPEPARAVAAAAFVLLLWLQVRKSYLAGVVLVAVNLTLRLCELVLYDNLVQVLWRRLLPTFLSKGKRAGDLGVRTREV